MRTFLSQLDTARKSLACVVDGENERSEIVSSGGVESATSLFRSPVVVLAAALVAAPPPKSVDILSRWLAEEICRRQAGGATAKRVD